jgi:hypothetical protein
LLNVFTQVANKKEITNKKITTDGAKSMTGQINGFIAPCRQHGFPDFHSYHCIIHQQVLAREKTQCIDCHKHRFQNFKFNSKQAFQSNS